MEAKVMATTTPQKTHFSHLLASRPSWPRSVSTPTSKDDLGDAIQRILDGLDSQQKERILEAGHMEEVSSKDEPSQSDLIEVEAREDVTEKESTSALTINNLQTCSNIATKLKDLIESVEKPLQNEIFEGIVRGFQLIGTFLEEISVQEGEMHHDLPELDFAIQEFLNNVEATLKALKAKTELFHDAKAVGIVDCCHIWLHSFTIFFKAFARRTEADQTRIHEVVAPSFKELQATKALFLKRV